MTNHFEFQIIQFLTAQFHFVERLPIVRFRIAQFENRSRGRGHFPDFIIAKLAPGRYSGILRFAAPLTSAKQVYRNCEFPENALGHAERPDNRSFPACQEYRNCEFFHKRPTVKNRSLAPTRRTELAARRSQPPSVHSNSIVLGGLLVIS